MKACAIAESFFSLMGSDEQTIVDQQIKNLTSKDVGIASSLERREDVIGA